MMHFDLGVDGVGWGAKFGSKKMSPRYQCDDLLIELGNHPCWEVISFE